MNQRVDPTAGKPKGKAVAANQKSIDGLPMNSGTWRVEGEHGLYVRARVASKSFYVQRRIRGDLVKATIGQMSLKDAREEAAKKWAFAEPKPAGGRKTFGHAFREFMLDGGKRGELADRTRGIYTYILNRHLADWKSRALEDIGRDEECGRVLYRRIRHKHGAATAAQVIRLVSAVYRHARKVNRKLPESPTVAVVLPPTRSRDWALSQGDLKAWWAAVKRLNPVKRAWWLVCLLTGARRGSVEALRWADLDLDRRIIRFMVAKGGRVYSVPMSRVLAALLVKYRDGGEAPPSDWVFPSGSKVGQHLADVRDDKRGVKSAHHLRHTFRTTLAELGATGDQARLLMGHTLGGDVSTGYITAGLLIESLRPLADAVAERLTAIIGDLA
jgi:integrase